MKKLQKASINLATELKLQTRLMPHRTQDVQQGSIFRTTIFMAPRDIIKKCDRLST